MPGVTIWNRFRDQRLPCFDIGANSEWLTLARSYEMWVGLMQRLSEL